MRRALMLVALLGIASMQAQFQPETEVDPTAYVVREDLASAGDYAAAERVVRFVQVSDAHIIDDDAPAPMRVEVFDEFGPPFEGAQRPHEEYTDEILDAAIRSINAIHGMDQLDFVVNTGDNIDNQLENELMRFIDNWEGTLTTTGPVSGLACIPDGQSVDAADADADESDQCTHLPDAVAANNTPLVDGLPWYSAFGNHDGLIQGNVPVQPSFNELADQFGRRFIDQEQYVDMHFQLGKCAGGNPGGSEDDDNGHGYGFAGDRLCDDDTDNDGYYSFEVRGVLFIVLDTVNDDFVTGNEGLQGMFNPQETLGYDVVGGYAEGAVDPEQFAWMQTQITGDATRPVVVMGHHTVNSMFSSRLEGTCEGGQCLDDLLTEAGYVTGPALVDELAAQPNVLAFIGGHTHQHRIEPKSTDVGSFWNIETSALVDHPQEPRVIEIWSAPDGKWFLKTDPVNHDFELGATLAASDRHLSDAAEGDADDQEVILWSDLPLSVQAEPMAALPRVIQLIATNASGEVGQPTDFIVRAEDQIRDEGIAGLQLSLGIGYTSGSGFTQVVVAGTNMTDAGNGSYTFTFTPTAGNTHFATVAAADPTERYDDVTQVFSISVPAGSSPAKKSPAPALGALALLAVVAVLRQNK